MPIECATTGKGKQRVDKFELNREDASYTLSLELHMPIDNVLLQVRVNRG